ncbi:MAG: Holliday junction resolvase RuvX [Actinobacteria bacterium]|nr:Holliday junction resolvase RuvX [Actinomycetota bacterium]
MTSRVLGVDLGDVRIGVALGDPSGVVATPFDTVPAPDDPEDVDAVVQLIADLADEQGCGTVVIGYPRTLDAREGKAARRSRMVAERLEETTGLRVELFDERFTTVEAERTMLDQDASRRERRAAVDRVAATLLLQAFLDRERARGPSGGGR